MLAKLKKPGKNRQKPVSRLLLIIVASTSFIVITIALGTYLIIVRQGETNAYTTLTILSMITGMIISVLTLMVNFFQWHATASQLLTPPSTVPQPSPDVTITTSPHPLQDWGDAPIVEHFYGRAQELATLKDWIHAQDCRLICIQGMGGIGKTLLTARVAQECGGHFDYVIWRSLQHAPPLEQILQHFLRPLLHEDRLLLPENRQEQIRLLMECLQRYRCLLILDNFESILQGGGRAGIYKAGYEDYGHLLLSVGSGRHKSCLLLTSREKPAELARLAGKMQPVRSLALDGVTPEDAQLILQHEDLHGDAETWRKFVARYGGNPLALKLVCEPVQDVFFGELQTFLTQQEGMLDDIADLLDQQFKRLSTREQELLYWLAIEREQVTLEQLLMDSSDTTTAGALLGVIQSLRRRSLVECHNVVSFSLQPVILEYVTGHFVACLQQEFSKRVFHLFFSHALIKAQARDYIRKSQIHFILSPLATYLSTTLGREQCESMLRDLLLSLHASGTHAIHYGAGNLLNLLIYLHIPLQQLSFSHLIIRQAFLQGNMMHDVDFSYADLATCVFTETFANILSVAVSCDQSMLAAGTANGKIEIWQLPHARPRFTLVGHSDWVRSVAFHPDGHLLASASDDHHIQLWDVSNGRSLDVLAAHTGRVYCITFSPDGSLLASGGDDRLLRLWHKESGKWLSIEHHNRIRSIAFSADGTTLVSGGDEESIYVWDTDGRCIKNIPVLGNPVYCVAFSPDDTMIASACQDGAVRLYSADSGECIRTLDAHRGRVRSIAFHPTKHILISGGEDQALRIWDTQNGRCLDTLAAHHNRVRDLTFSRDGSFAVSGSDDQTIHIWETQHWHKLNHIQGHSHWIYALALNITGTAMASEGENFSIQLRHPQTTEVLQTLHGHTNWINTLAFSPDGSLLASGSDDQRILLWNLAEGVHPRELASQQERVRAIAFNSTGHILASGGEDCCIHLWSIASGENISTLRGHTDRVRSVAFADATLLLSAGDDGIVRLWDAESGQCTQALCGHNGRVWSAVFHPAGTYLASGGDDGMIYFWETGSGKNTAKLQGHHRGIYTLAFNRSGTLLASGSEDRTIRLWNTETGRCLHVLHGHSSRIRALQFCPDGTTLISGSHDGTLKMWDSATAQCTATIRNDRPYERMNITGVRGLARAQVEKLKILGAVEHPPSTGSTTIASCP